MNQQEPHFQKEINSNNGLILGLGMPTEIYKGRILPGNYLSHQDNDISPHYDHERTILHAAKISSEHCKELVLEDASDGGGGRCTLVH